LPIAKNTLSGHLAILKAAGLATAERQATQQIYHLNLSVLEEALMTFMDGMAATRAGPSKEEAGRNRSRRAR
jgi:DNA-binding transcriptional ArsR family regulator